MLKVVKPQKKPQKPLNLEWLKGVGGAVKEVFIVASAHPATAALAVMASSVIVNVASGAYKQQTETQTRLHTEMKGIYEGAQSLGIAGALAPVALAGLQAASSIAAARKPPV